MQDALARFYADVEDIDSAKPNGYATTYVAEALFPAGMLNEEITSLDAASPLLSDGSWYGSAYVDFIDDASWGAYVDGLGLDRAAFCDPAHPRAIAVNSYDIRSDDKYANVQPFAQTETIDSLEFADLDGSFVEGIVDGPDGSRAALCYDSEGNAQHLSLDEAVAQDRPIEIGALADQVPPCATGTEGTLQLFLPASSIGLADEMGYFRASMTFDAGGSAERASDAQDAIEEVAADYPELDVTYTNIAQGKLQARLMAVTVNTFIYLFAAICGLIAVANVFNTLTNALMLRRREFAMLKSVGMGNRAFRRMIAYECASYAWHGFAIGLALALLATYGLYQAMMLSYATYRLTLSWAEIGASLALMVAVIAISVAYALRRSRAANVVEALRDDAL